MANINISRILMKRGNTAAASTYTGPLGELVVDTGLHTVRVQDGVTAGGMAVLATNAQIQALSNSISTISGIDSNFVANINTLLANAAVQSVAIGNLQAFQTYANTHFGSSNYGNANVVSLLGNYSNTIQWTGGSQIYEDTVLVAQGSIAVALTSPGATTITAGTNTWTFSNVGELTVPGPVITQYGNIESGTIGPGLTLMSNVDAGQYFNGFFVGNTTNREQSYIYAEQSQAGIGVTNITTNQFNLWTFNDDASISAPGDLNIVGNINFTASPAGAITGASLVSAQQFYSNGNLIIGNSTIGQTTHRLLGNVLIGANSTLGSDSILTITRNPNATIPDSFEGSLLHLISNDNGNARIISDSYGVGVWPAFTGRRARGTAASPSPLLGNDIILRIAARPYGNTGFLTGGTGRISMITEGIITDTSGPTAISFEVTAANTIARNEAMRIASTGNVLIQNNTASTSTTTGALVVSHGGAGIVGNLNVGGTVVVNSGVFWANGVAFSSGSTYGNIDVGAYLYNTDLVSNANINVGTTQSVHHIAGNLIIGPYDVDRASGDSAFTINLAPEVPQVSNAVVHVSGANNKSTTMSIDSYGNAVSSVYTVRRARGSTNAPSQVLVGDPIGGYLGRGYGATGFYTAGNVSSTPGLVIFATENHTDTAQGTYLSLRTTANGNVLATEAVQVNGNGSIVVSGAVIANNYNFANGVNILSTVAGTYSNTNVASYLSTYSGNIANISFANGNLNLGAIQNPADQTGTIYNVKGIVGMTASSGANISGFSTVSASNFTFGNGVNILSTIAPSSSYGNANVAAYLTANPPTGTYANTNVAAYLTANPPTGTYANTNVAAYLTTQTFYSNSNVAAYLVANPQGSTYSNANVVANLANYVTNIVSTANITANYFVGNGAALTNLNYNSTGNIVGTSSNVSLVAGSYSWTFDNTGNLTIPTTGNIIYANGTVFSSGTGSGGAGTTYTNANVISMLAANTAVFVGPTGVIGNVATGNIQANATAIFLGANTVISNYGSPTFGYATHIGNNVYFDANGVMRYRNTQTGASDLIVGPGALYWYATGGAVTANTATGYTGASGAYMAISTSGMSLYNGAGLVSSGAITIQNATGLVTNQATTGLFQNASTINAGTASGILSVGQSGAGTGSLGNVTIGAGTVQTGAVPLTVRASGIYNTLILTNIAGGYNSPPYTAQAVTGGSGTGMTASYSTAGNGYVTQASLVVVNPGTGYKNGDVVTLPNGLGTTATLYNYNPNIANSTTTGTANYVFGIDGNLALPGNVSHVSNTFIFGDFTNSTVNYRTIFAPLAANSNPGIYAAPSGTGTAASWQAANNSNLTNASKILIATNGTTDVQLVSGVNGSGTYLPLSFYNNGAAQMQLSVSGNLTMVGNGNIITNANVYSGNVVASYFYGNGAALTGITANVAGNIYGTSTNVTIIAGTYSSTFANTGVVTMPNVTVTGNLTIGNVTTTMATNGYNNWKANTYANVDNISASVFSNGVPAVSSITGTLNYFWSSVTNLTGGKFWGNTSTGGAVTTTPTVVGSVNGPLAIGGDTVTVTFQDQDLKRIYTITYAQTVGSGNCAIVATRIL